MLFNLENESLLISQSHGSQDHVQRLNRPPVVTNHAAYIFTRDLDLEHGNRFGHCSLNLNLVRNTRKEPKHLLDEQPCSLNIGIPGLGPYLGHIYSRYDCRPNVRQRTTF